jgi:hyperosmotically inducible periplasmic protein
MVDKSTRNQKGEFAMQKWKKSLRLLLCIILLLGLCCCRTAAGRSAGQVFDDLNITTVIKTKIFNDPYLSGFAISVDTFQGEVTLTGAVESEFAKNRVTDLAQSIEGVRKVNNVLVVR